MNLDIDKIASRRARMNGRGRQPYGSMSYLTDRINADLLDRIEINGVDVQRWLLIDFDAAPITLPGAKTSQFSLLEGDSIADILEEANTPFDGAVVNLQLGWFDPDPIYAMLTQALVPGGKLFFSVPGPDTLTELHMLWMEVDDAPHVHMFTDMHHLGDKLLRSGFTKPIMDADWIGVEYDDIDLLMQDLRQEGMQNILSERRKTLTGKNRFNRFRQLAGDNDGKVQMTFEIVYGYAEAPVQSSGIVKVNAPIYRPSYTT